jgi:hypothetical protein
MQNETIEFAVGDRVAVKQKGSKFGGWSGVVRSVEPGRILQVHVDFDHPRHGKFTDVGFTRYELFFEQRNTQRNIYE